MHTKKASIDDMTQSLLPLYNNQSKSPTTLFELSPSQYVRMKKNSIHITGLSLKASPGKKDNKILYSQAMYGSNLKASTRRVDIGDNKQYKLLQLNKTKYNYCIVTADKAECLQWFPNTHVYGSSMTDKRGLSLTKNIPLSGIVVLMLSSLPSGKNTFPIQDIFDDELYSKVKSCKPNVMATYDHHGSNGSCFSFGNKPLYGKVSDKSVGIYTTKNSKSESRQIVINDNAKYVEEMCCDVIVHAVLSLSKIIPDLKYLLSPIIDTAEKIQTVLNDVVLQKVKSSSSGC